MSDTPEQRRRALLDAAVMAGEAYSAESLARLMAERGELEAIVRDLATASPRNRDDACHLCGIEFSDFPRAEWDRITDPLSHPESCVLRRAVAWVSAHPVSGDPQ